MIKKNCCKTVDYLSIVRVFQLAEANTNLSMQQSKYQRELDMLKQRTAAMVDINKYHELGSQVAETERKFREMELAMEKSANETNKMIIGKIVI